MYRELLGDAYMAPNPPEAILVIKHGALGDIILASGHMKAIREHHLVYWRI